MQTSIADERDLSPEPLCEVVAVGASAGGIEALQRLLGGLPADFGAAVCVVVHMPPTGGPALAAILHRAGALPATVARDGERLRPGRIYVAPGDRHLTVVDGRLHVAPGPRENGHRPAIDPLFRSVADQWGARGIGVVLSGSLSDGTAGLAAIRRHGGTAVVQDPEDAMYTGMPHNAIDHAGADHVLPATEIGGLLVDLCRPDSRGHAAEPVRPAPLERSRAPAVGVRVPRLRRRALGVTRPAGSAVAAVPGRARLVGSRPPQPAVGAGRSGPVGGVALAGRPGRAES